MRLPWPFGRSTEPPEGEAAGQADSSQPGSTPAAPAARDRAPASERAWATLPPIQRAIGAAPLVAPSEPFLAGVPGARPLPPIVEHLGHDVSPLAPVGLVGAPVHPTPSLTSQVALVPRPVQRRAEPSGSGWSSAIEPDAPETPRDAPEAPPSPAAPPAPEPPARTLSVVPPEATVHPPSRPLTHAETTAVTGSTRGPAGAGAGSGQASRPEPGQRPLVSRRTQISSGAPTRAAGAAGPMPAAAVPAASAPAAPSMPVTVSRTTESPVAASAPLAPPGDRGRRAGLGAPLPATPPTAVSPEVAQAFPAPVLARLAAAKAAGPGPDDLAPGPAQAAAGETAGPLHLAHAPRTARPIAGAAPLQTTILRRTSEPAAPGSPGSDASVDSGAADAPGLHLAQPVTAQRGSLPVLPVVGGGGHDGGLATAASPMSSGPIQRTTTGAPQADATPTGNGQNDRPATGRPVPPLRRRLMGSRPIQTSVQTQRSGEPSSSDGPEPGEERRASAPGVPTQASLPAGLTAGAPAIGFRGEALEPSWGAGRAGSPQAGPGPAASPGRTLPAVPGVQRRDASGSDEPRSTVLPGHFDGRATGGASPTSGFPTKGAPASWSLARGSVPAAAPAAPATAHAAVQRAPGGPAEPRLARRPVAPYESGAGPHAWPAAPAAPAPMAEMPLVRIPSPIVPASVATAAAASPTISRSIVAAAPAATPAVQASTQDAAAGGGPVLGVTAMPVIQRIDASAPTTAAPTAEHSDKELDELARALFGRIRNRLRSEYIHEREAKGLTFDNP